MFLSTHAKPRRTQRTSFHRKGKTKGRGGDFYLFTFILASRNGILFAVFAASSEKVVSNKEE
ncbi:MAG: hypothetical protein B1H02_01355 [Candidatus Latescibacteria bacterium 4484_107]|nr:MAG: hypothetical protein B1H02_01355 [Candidatus Latescibacteria bacterium 4484_107]